MLIRTGFRRSSRQKGFSLVELMVSILIGLIILAGVIQVVFSGKRAFLSQEDLSFIQENARYAVSVLGKDIRAAGYWGCSGSLTNTSMVLTSVAGSEADLLSGSSLAAIETEAGTAIPAIFGFVGFEADMAQTFPEDDFVAWGEDADHYADNAIAPNLVRAPDSFVVRYAGGEPLRIMGDDNATSLLTVAQGTDQLPDQGILVASSAGCDSMGVFASNAVIEGVAGGLPAYAISYADNGVNCTNKIKPDKLGSFDCTGGLGTEGGTSYRDGDSVMQYVARGYFIEESDVLPGQPALKRRILTAEGGVLGTTTEEIAVGVEDMALLYGVQTVGGIQFKTATEVTDDNEWSALSSVQLSLVFRAQSQSMDQIDDDVRLGNQYNDRRMRQVVTTTFQLRNRI